MTIYVLIGISLSLVGVAGLQFFYLAYLEGLSRDQKKRISELERRCMYLNDRLFESELQVKEQTNIIAQMESYFEDEADEEIWADVLDEN